MRPLRAVGAVILAGSILLCSAGCQRVEPHPSSVSEACAVAVPGAMSLYDPSRSGGAAGFGSISSLDAPPSAYYTGWSLRLGRYVDPNQRPDLPGAKQVIASMLDSRNALQEGLSALDRTRLATISATILGEPNLSANPYLVFQSGSQYSSEIEGQPSPSATYIAIDGLTSSGLPVPKVVSLAVAHQTGSYGGNESIQEIVNIDAPTLAAAALSLTPGEFHKAAPSAQTTIDAWRSTILATGPGATQAAVLGMLAQASSAQGLNWSPPPKGFFDQLRVGDTGFYSLDGKSGIDPQLTLAVGQSGVRLDAPAVRRTLKVGKGIHGWLGGISSPDLGSTFSAAIVLSECGAVIPDISELMAGEQSRLASQDHVDPREAYQYLWLARIAVHSPPSGLVDRLRLQLQTEFDSSSDSGELSGACEALLAARLAGSDVRGWQTQINFATQPSDIRVVREIAQIGVVEHDSRLERASAQYLKSFRWKDEYSYTRDRLGQRDLYSAAYGRGPSKLGGTSNIAFVQAFQVSGFWTIEPRNQTPNSPATMSSAAFALALLGAKSTYEPLLFL
jgi:hypothetical protein